MQTFTISAATFANKIIIRPCLSALQKLYCVLDCTEICKDILDFSHCGDDYPPVKETSVNPARLLFALK